MLTEKEELQLEIDAMEEFIEFATEKLKIKHIECIAISEDIARHLNRIRKLKDKLEAIDKP